MNIVHISNRVDMRLKIKTYFISQLVIIFSLLFICIVTSVKQYELIANMHNLVIAKQEYKILTRQIRSDISELIHITNELVTSPSTKLSKELTQLINLKEGFLERKRSQLTPYLINTTDSEIDSLVGREISDVNLLLRNKYSPIEHSYVVLTLSTQSKFIDLAREVMLLVSSNSPVGFSLNSDKLQEDMNLQIDNLSREFDSRFNKELYQHQISLKRISFTQLVALTIIFFVLVTSTVFAIKWISKPITQISRLTKNYMISSIVNTEPDMRPSPIIEIFYLNQNISTLINNMDHTLNTVNSHLRTAEKLKKQADSANKAKTMFLANMSHEIRTPLNGLNGFLYLLQHTKLTHEQTEFVQTSKLILDHLSSVIGDVLDFSKIEAGKLDIDTHHFDVFELFKEVEVAILPNVTNKKQLLLFKIENINQNLVCDPVRIKQIVLNLLSNAVKFTPQKGKITVSIRKLNTKPLTLEIIITDSGIGISSEQLSKIYAPFEQADNTTARSYGGTGLGISIAHKLCKLLGGDLDIQSIPNVGTTCTATVELKDAYGEECSSKSLLKGKRFQLEVRSKHLHYRLVEHILNLGGEVNKESVLGHKSNEKCHLLCDSMYISTTDIKELNKYDKIIHISNLDSDISRVKPILAELGKGSSIVHLPFLPCSWNRILGFSLNTPNPPQKDLSLQGINVLLAEDVEFNQVIVTKIIERVGGIVTCVKNGAEALATLRLNTSFNVILMDIHMPIMNGLQATKLIRKELRLTIPIIALTANISLENQKECSKVGFNGFLKKPFEAHDLLDMINEN